MTRVDTAPRWLAVFDLDGTLTWRDTLVLFLLSFLRRHPWRVFGLWRLPFALLSFVARGRDRGALKSRVGYRLRRPGGVGAGCAATIVRLRTKTGSMHVNLVPEGRLFHLAAGFACRENAAEPGDNEIEHGGQRRPGSALGTQTPRHSRLGAAPVHGRGLRLVGEECSGCQGVGSGNQKHRGMVEISSGAASISKRRTTDVEETCCPARAVISV